MKKTYYFQHDYNARNDPKLQAVMIKYGLAGIGAFWCIVEMLYEQNGTLPITSISGIAYTLHADEEMLKNIVCKMDLFECNKNFFWSRSVRKRLGFFSKISETRRKAAEKRWKSSKKDDANAMQMQKKTMQMQCKPNAIAMQTECNCNAIKEKNIKGYNIEEDNNGSSLRSEPSSTRAVDAVMPSGGRGEISGGTEKKKDDTALMEKVMRLYNQAADGTNLPRVKLLTDKRAAAVRARAKDYGLEAVAAVIAKTAESNFLNGDNRNGFTASFDWMMRPNNFPKILEGNYDNRKPPVTTATTQNRNRNGNEQQTDYERRTSEFAAHIRAKLAASAETEELPDALRLEGEHAR